MQPCPCSKLAFGDRRSEDDQHGRASASQPMPLAVQPSRYPGPMRTDAHVRAHARARQWGADPIFSALRIEDAAVGGAVTEGATDQTRGWSPSRWIVRAAGPRRCVT